MDLPKALGCCCISECRSCTDAYPVPRQEDGESESSILVATISTTFVKVPGAIFYVPVAVTGWLKRHFHLMRTGDAPNFRVEFSWIVAVSSLLYLMVALAYFFEACYFTGFLFCCITVSSLFSDSLQPSSKTWCCLDRSLATLGAVFGPLRAIILHAASLIVSAKIAGLSIFSLLFLAWSRRSSCQEEFIFRHSCWHLSSSVSLVWLAMNVPFYF